MPTTVQPQRPVDTRDLAGRQLLVFRDPVADPAAERGHRYASHTAHAEADTVSPQAAPAAGVAVRELLP